MKVGVLKETKDREMRVALLPSGVRVLSARGHGVVVERGAGVNSGFPDAQYEEAGAKIFDRPADLIAFADILVKVKEPTLEEVSAMRPGQVLFDFLHLAPLKELTDRILAKQIIAI